MTLFQIVAAWLLRAALVWAILEASFGLYAQGAIVLERQTALRTHGERMQRLERDTAAATATAQALRQDLAALSAHAEVAPPGRTPSTANMETLRTELTTLGASEVMIEAAETPVSADLSKVTLTARWREPADRNPVALQALAAQRPALRIARVSLERAPGAGLVETNATFELLARPGPSP